MFYTHYIVYYAYTPIYFLLFQCLWQRMAVGGEEGVAWQQVGVASDSSIRAGVSDPCADGALHTSTTGKGILGIHVCFWVIVFFF